MGSSLVLAISPRPSSIDKSVWPSEVRSTFRSKKGALLKQENPAADDIQRIWDLFPIVLCRAGGLRARTRVTPERILSP